MVRASKPVSASGVPSTPVAAVPAANTVISEKKAPAVSKKAAAPKADASAPKEASASKAVTSTEDDAAEATTIESSATEKLAAYATLLASANTVITQLKTQFKVLEKSIQKELKFAQKVSSRKVKRSGNRKPSGFVCPTLISNELCAFLGKPAGTLMARTDVSRDINAYIKTHALKDVTNGRQINPDAKLTALLQLKAGDDLTYFNLQRYMKHHFIKAATPTATA
jgi:chromatin remodeling complex protein RSC6